MVYRLSPGNTNWRWRSDSRTRHLKQSNKGNKYYKSTTFPLKRNLRMLGLALLLTQRRGRVCVNVAFIYYKATITNTCTRKRLCFLFIYSTKAYLNKTRQGTSCMSQCCISSSRCCSMVNVIVVMLACSRLLW